MRLSPLVCSFLLLCSTTAAQSVVFDNTTTYLGQENDLLENGQVASVERGSTLTLGGSERAVVQLDFVQRIQGAGPADFDAQVRLYANDGAGGSPGTLLWASPVQSFLIDSGAPLQFGFAIPEVLVPDTFTWSLQLSDRSGNAAEMGPSLFSPPSVGSAALGYWERTGPGPADWVAGGAGEAPFGARVSAIAGTPVPLLGGPGILALAGVLAAAAVLVLRARAA